MGGAVTAALGAGASPAGAGVAGLGTPATADAQADALLTDTLGVARSSRAIGTDPDHRGQYVFAGGNVQGMPDAQQLVLIAFATDLGSAADASIGNRIGKVRTLGDNAVAELTAAVNETVADLVKRGIVRVESVEIDVDRTNARSTQIARFTDLASGRTFAVPLA